MGSSPEDPTRLILVLGGARSGKSTFAERLAAQYAATRAAEDAEPVAGSATAAPLHLVDAGHPDAAPQGGAGRVTFLATSETNDQEMADRVAAHRSVRPDSWVTVECPTEVAAAVRADAGPVFLLDCVTFWVSNLMFAAGDLGGTVPEGLGNFDKEFIPADVERAVAARVTGAVDDLLAALGETNCTLIAVSNEVGLGVVPEYPIARLYRDELGRANRRLAEAADEVFLLVAGIPVELRALAVDPFSVPEAYEAHRHRRPPHLAPPPSSPTEEEHDE